MKNPVNKYKSLFSLIETREKHFFPIPYKKCEAEGGCGVIGFASSEKVTGKHLLPALMQMCNRGNGKGGGIAASGLRPSFFNTTSQILENNTLLAIAYLDEKSRTEVEKASIEPLFEIDHIYLMSHLANTKSLKGMEVIPPEVIVYFVRVKCEALAQFKEEKGLHSLEDSSLEDELIYQNSFQLNRSFYSAEGEKKAFVLSHGKDLLVLKAIGYGDEVIRYYQLEECGAHVWIGHHRYPTKGKVWHPGGAHPFVGLNEALVHNGDFANYSSICQSLAQKRIYPLFMTDTEVSVLAFDLLHRTYGYSLEYVIEALAPTTERDFSLLSQEKQTLYDALQKTHIHLSPDGPWFFLIAQSVIEEQRRVYRLIGITDTSMLRPQIFALQKGDVSIGLAASEKQAIDATLRSLEREDNRYCSVADLYWNARGGSHTDGGAFSFSISKDTSGKPTLECTDKFGSPIEIAPTSKQLSIDPKEISLPDGDVKEFIVWVKNQSVNWSENQIADFVSKFVQTATSDASRHRFLEVMTFLTDHCLPTPFVKRSRLLAVIEEGFSQFVKKMEVAPSQNYVFMGKDLDPPFVSPEQILIVDARGFPSEGEHSLARALVRTYLKGFRKWKIFHCRGQRFLCNGLGPNSQNVQIDIYGSSGDYLGSGIDGAEVIVHGDGQDQLGQIMKGGKLVVFGNVGQTFMYGAKGGTSYVKGSAAGRPLINAVGKAKAIINGTCLDYLAESFMAGDPHQEGGFVILNGLQFTNEGLLDEMATPYPGNNLFSLASGGAIYLRDPEKRVSEVQLNGGKFVTMTEKDWHLILPYLEQNDKLFNIPIGRLLSYKGESLPFNKAYRKISPAIQEMQEEEAWVKAKVKNKI